MIDFLKWSVKIKTPLFNVKITRESYAHDFYSYCGNEVVYYESDTAFYVGFAIVEFPKIIDRISGHTSMEVM